MPHRGADFWTPPRLRAGSCRCGTGFPFPNLMHCSVLCLNLRHSFEQVLASGPMCRSAFLLLFSAFMSFSYPPVSSLLFRCFARRTRARAEDRQGKFIGSRRFYDVSIRFQPSRLFCVCVCVSTASRALIALYDPGALPGRSVCVSPINWFL